MVSEVHVLWVILDVELRMARKETTVTHCKVQFYHFTGSGKGGEQITINRPRIVPGTT